jgi:hypothetical protein
MPQTKAWSAKRARQFEQIQQSQLDSGKSAPLAARTAARIVNRERVEQGEAQAVSPRGGQTFRQLRNEARDRGLAGRSTMNKTELEEALKR